MGTIETGRTITMPKELLDVFVAVEKDLQAIRDGVAQEITSAPALQILLKEVKAAAAKIRAKIAIPDLTEASETSSPYLNLDVREAMQHLRSEVEEILVETKFQRAKTMLDELETRVSEGKVKYLADGFPNFYQIAGEIQKQSPADNSFEYAWSVVPNLMQRFADICVRGTQSIERQVMVSLQREDRISYPNTQALRAMVDFAKKIIRKKSSLSAISLIEDKLPILCGEEWLRECEIRIKSGKRISSNWMNNAKWITAELQSQYSSNVNYQGKLAELQARLEAIEKADAALAERE